MSEEKPPQKDDLKPGPKLKLVKKSLTESPHRNGEESTKGEFDPTAAKFLEFARNHAKRVAKIMAMMGLKPSADPLTTQRMMRMTEEELDSLEEGLSRKSNNAAKGSQIPDDKDYQEVEAGDHRKEGKEAPQDDPSTSG